MTTCVTMLGGSEKKQVPDDAHDGWFLGRPEPELAQEFASWSGVPGLWGDKVSFQANQIVSDRDACFYGVSSRH